MNLTHSSSRNYKFTETVTIKSADPANRAVVNELFLRGVSNVTISEVDFDYTGEQGADTLSWQLGQPFYAEGATNLTLDNILFDGALNAAGVGVDTGLRIKTSTGVAVTNSEMTDFKIGMNIASSSDVTISGNSISQISQDGLFLGALDGITIEDNVFGGHVSANPDVRTGKDAVQFYTNASIAPSEDIVIRGNSFESDDQRLTISIGNEVFSSTGAYHREVLIEDNAIQATYPHGATVNHADGVTIRGNAVVYDPDQPAPSSAFTVSSSSLNVTLEANTVEADTSGGPRTITVSTQAELDAALRTLLGGETILLAAGDYADLNLTHSSSRNFKFTETVTIKSANVNDRAVVNEFFLRGVSNVTISDIDFDFDGTQGADTLSWQAGQPFYVEGASNLTLERLLLDGSPGADGFGTGTGLRVKTSTGVTVSDSELVNFKIGMNIATSADITIQGNSLKQMSQDGLYLGDLDRVLIEDNYFGDYASANPTVKTSKDAIQIYTSSSTPPSTEVTIRGNSFESNDQRQNITIGNESYSSTGAFHENIVIEDNHIRTANPHGVTLNHTDGVTIRGNTVVYDAGQPPTTSVITVSSSSRGVTVADNTSYPEAAGGAETFLVGTQAELMAALAAVESGDTILLKAGTYADLDMTHSSSRNYKFTEAVTIKSANANDRAVVNELFLRGVTNLVIEDIDFDYTGSQAANTASWQVGQPFYVENATNLTLDGLLFDGHLNANGVGSATGLRIKGSTGVTVTDSTLTDFKYGVNLTASSGVTFEGNTITQMSQDGLYIGDVSGLVIADNVFGPHRTVNPSSATNMDAIEIYTASGIGASDDIAITGNSFEGAALRQNINISNAAYRAATPDLHRGILIEDNYIETAHPQGVSVAHADDVTIRDNVVAYDANRAPTKPVIEVTGASQNVEIAANTVYADKPGYSTFVVGTQAELQAALNQVRSGDTILLKAGTYADLDMTHSTSRNYKFTEAVTIKSADPENRAVVNELFLRGVTNLVIEDVVFDYNGTQAANTASWQLGQPFYVENATNVTLDGLVFDGHVNAQGFGVDTGLRIKGSTGLTLSDSEMTSFNIGMNVATSGDLTIVGNTFTQLNRDGLFLGDIDGILIEDNYIGNWNSSAPTVRANKDAIQVYTNASTPTSEGITIRGNTFESDDHRQNVTILNEAYSAAAPSFNRDILIEDNYFHTVYPQGATVSHGDGVTIRNNVVSYDADQMVNLPVFNVSASSRNVSLSGNEIHAETSEEAPETFVVSNQAELTLALEELRGGDTLLIEGGTYQTLNMQPNAKNNFKFNETVVIRAADPDDRPVFREMVVRDTTNLVLKDLDFDYTGTQPAGTDSWRLSKPFFIDRVTNVVLDGLNFEGHLNAEGFGSGTGLRVGNSSNVTITGIEVTDFRTGVNLWNITGVTFVDNVLRRMNHDGIFVGGLKNAVIEDNFIGDYRAQFPLALHQDGIQVFTDASTAPLENVTIRGNTLESADTKHGIFIFNELYRDGNASAATMHRNLLIEDNFIRTANTHGITVTHADGVTIRNNTVAHNTEGDVVQIPLINVSTQSKNVKIVGNTVNSVQDSQDGTWQVHDNDTSVRSLLHWDGIFVNGVLQPSVRPLGQDASRATHFELDREDFSGSGTLAVLDLDFADGDRLDLKGFDTGSFVAPAWDKSLAVSAGGGAVRIDSFGDLIKLDDAPGITVTETGGGDDLLLAIDQGSRGIFHILLDDVAGLPEGIF